MTESPFATVHRIITEPVNTHDELCIIAKDAAHLSSSDREILRRAANELEILHHALIMSTTELIEARQKHIATNDQLIAERRHIAALIAPKIDERWHIGSGPMNIIGYSPFGIAR